MKHLILTVTLTTLLTAPAMALDDAHWRKADDSINKGIAFLRTQQAEDGSWSPKAGPAVTAMVVAVMLDRPDIGPDDPHVAKGLTYILSKARPDGGIHDGILENYNTAICLSALARVNTMPEAAEAIKRGQDFLRGLQWAGQTLEDGTVVDENHPFYGGAGYGNHGRPDLSNTQIMLQGLYDSGLDCNDPAFQRAMVFISRLQGIPQNEQFADKIEQDGGFIYATSVNKDLPGVPQSMASPEMVDEAKAGRPVSRLRTYGSMTYAGFKSYLYAQLDRDDIRVQAAYEWIRNNYTLDQNPGMPETIRHHGLYYYYVTFARGLKAWGSSTLTTADGQGHDWANDLIARLVSLQREDGSWTNDADRWMEGDNVLVTAYAITALLEAVR
jgi:squalene-hopene/tetraprenyl-beta-curcumene cyclase